MEEKKLFNPVVFNEVDPRIMALGNKTPEEKTYIILYERILEDGDRVQEFKICIGRKDTYDEVVRLVTSYNIDIHNSVVLVEIAAVDINGKADWFIKNPASAPSIYNFCLMMEKFFGTAEFNIEDYNDKPVEENTTPAYQVQSSAVFENDELANVYNEAMKDK